MYRLYIKPCYQGFVKLFLKVCYQGFVKLFLKVCFFPYMGLWVGGCLFGLVDNFDVCDLLKYCCSWQLCFLLHVILIIMVFQTFKKQTFKKSLIKT